MADYDDSHKAWPNIVRYECASYARHRISHLNRRIADKDMWFHDMSVYKLSDLDFMVSRYGLPDNDKNPWSLYVNGFTFDWQKFIDKHGMPPSFVSRREHNIWREDVFQLNIDDYILRKDLVFEVVKYVNEPLESAGDAAKWIIDGLADKGMLHINTECMFNGRDGYYVVVPDAEEFFDDIGYSMYKRTAKSLSLGAMSVARYLLDEFFPDTHVRDRDGRRRDYEHFYIELASMFPQGVRRCAYTLTESGRIVLPVTCEELSEINDVDYYKPYRIMHNYHIKGRGTPSVKDWM